MVRVITLLSIAISLYGLEIVDRYLEMNNTYKALNRLFYLAQDERNFIVDSFGEFITPEEIVYRVRKIEKMVSGKEREAVKNFFKQKEIEENLFIKSYLLFQEKRYSEVVELCKEILDYYPNNPYALIYLAQSSIRTKDHTSAENSYIKLIQLYPNNIAYRYELIDLYLHDEKIEKAKKVFDEVEKRFPKDRYLDRYRKEIEERESILNRIFEKIQIW